MYSTDAHHKPKPPICGLSHNITLLRKLDLPLLFMHDGASTFIDDATGRHGGDAKVSRLNYNALSSPDQQAVVNFTIALKRERSSFTPSLAFARLFFGQSISLQ